MAQQPTRQHKRPTGAGWLNDVRAFNQFVSSRRRDKSHPVFRFTAMEIRFAITTLIATAVTMASLDQWYVFWIKAGEPDKSGFFNWITPIGNAAWIFVLFGGIIILMSIFNLRHYPGSSSIYWHRLYHATTYVLLCVLVGGLITLALKNGIGRIRPQFAGEDIFMLKPFGGLYDHASFPSGHSATVGSLAMCIALLFPRLAYPVFFAGILVALSRAMVEAHFPSDIIAGFAIGVATSWYMALAFARMRFVFHFLPSGKPTLRKGWKGDWANMFKSLFRQIFSKDKR